MRASRTATLRVGYMEARSHAVVEIDHCPIAEPGLARGGAAPRPRARPGARGTAQAPRHPDHPDGGRLRRRSARPWPRRGPDPAGPDRARGGPRPRAAVGARRGPGRAAGARPHGRPGERRPAAGLVPAGDPAGRGDPRGPRGRGLRRARSGSPTCSRAPAPSPCASPSGRRSMRPRPTAARSRPSTAPRGRRRACAG